MVNFENMLSMIILKYFQIFPCIHYITDIQNSNINIPYPCLIQNNTKNTSKYLQLIKCEGFVIISENLTLHLMAIEKQLRHTDVFRYTNRRYLLVSKGEMNVAEFFSLENFKFIRDVVLVIPLDVSDCKPDFGNGIEIQMDDWNFCTGYNFWTHQYVTNSSFTPILLCTWFVNTAFLNTGLYPNKVSNQLGRKFSVSAVNYKPFVNTETDRGVELSMIKSFVNYYNFSGIYYGENNYWGKVRGNFTGYGSKFKTANGFTDVSLGGFYGVSERYHHFEVSIATVKSAMSFLVPGPTLNLGFSTPLRPFSTTSWVFIGVFFIILCGSFYCLNYLHERFKLKNHESRENVIFIMFALLMLQSPTLKLRVYGAFVLICVILLSSFYSSGLASRMAKPSYKNEIRTLEDLENSNLAIIGVSATEIEKAMNDRRYNSIVKRYDPMTKNYFLEYRKKTKQFAMTLEHFASGYSLGDFESVLDVNDIENHRIVKEDLSYEVCVILAYKHSVYIPAIDLHLLYIKQAGLDYYWLLMAFRDMNHTFRQYFDFEFTHNTVKLNWQSVEGTFGFWVIGLIIATFQFILEVYQEYKQRS